MISKTPPRRGALAGLVLAAGESSRMGQEKALLPYHGRNFVETVIAKLREAGMERVVVVLGHHADTIQKAADLTGAEVVINPGYRRGQASSLQAGLVALANQAPGALARAAPEAIVLALVDHPAFSPGTARALIATFERTNAPAVIPACGGQRGHPVLISQALFAPLLDLKPNEGANAVIRAWREQTQFIEVADPGILVDIDTPEAYRAMMSAG